MFGGGGIIFDGLPKRLLLASTGAIAGRLPSLLKAASSLFCMGLRFLGGLLRGSIPVK